MLLALYMLSVYAGGSVKTVEVRIMKFSELRPCSLCGMFHTEILTVTPSRGRQTREGEENKPLSSFKR